MSDLTSVCLCTYISSDKRLNDLIRVLQSLEANLMEPCEVIIVDDKSPLVEDTLRILNQFKESIAQSHPDIPVVIHVNETNLKHARSQNKSMALAKGNCLIHIEDDCAIGFKGWNQVFAKYLRDHPEVGQVLPRGSGRGEHLPRCGYPFAGYAEFSWGIGGIFAIKREVYDKLGPDVWYFTLVHQIEQDFNFRVRMAGWRLAEIREFSMLHFGEGDQVGTFEREAQVHIGVYNFLKKWNLRFFGTFSYRDVWCQSQDDFPINVAFRRQLAAHYAAMVKECDKILADPDAAANSKEGAKKMKEAYGKCRMNEKPEPFVYPGHSGQFELVRLIRPPGREREDELIEKVGNNYVFGDIPQLHHNIKDLATRMGKNMTDEEVTAYLAGKEVDYSWEAKTEYL